MDILQTNRGVSRGTRKMGSQSQAMRLTLQRRMADYEARVRERIVQAREAQGLSPEQLALRADMSAKQVRRIEKGESFPRLSTVRKIAEATEKEVTWLRPDLDAEEARLHLQLEQLEEKLDALLQWAVTADQREAVAALQAKLEEIDRRSEARDDDTQEGRNGR